MNGNNLYRKPTQYEQERIFLYMQKYVVSMIKYMKTGEGIFTAVGIFSLVTLNASGASVIAAIIVGLISFGIAFYCIFSKKSAQRELNAYKCGNYLIMDGYCSKLVTDPQKVGIERADFTSKDGTYTNTHNRIASHNDNYVGMPLILIFPQTKDIKNKTVSVFSQYMLSDECLNRL